jgi:hypothetical protein
MHIKRKLYIKAKICTVVSSHTIWNTFKIDSENIIDLICPLIKLRVSNFLGYMHFLCLNFIKTDLNMKVRMKYKTFIYMSLKIIEISLFLPTK